MSPVLAEGDLSAEVSNFVQLAMPTHMQRKARAFQEFGFEEIMEWHRILYKKGWVAPHWPVEYGGLGWDATLSRMFDDALEYAGAPFLFPFGLRLIGPTIIRFGTAPQRSRFLSKILSGEEFWCQGYSEIDAGSDLASVATTAVRDGDTLVVNGHKMWTSLAQHADWMFALVRTDRCSEKRRGLTMLLIDCRSPGITVRPIRTISGRDAVSQVFLDEVRVPLANVVGPLNGGWDVAKFLLEFERESISSVQETARALRRCRRIVQNSRSTTGAPEGFALFGSKLSALEIRYANLRTVVERTAEVREADPSLAVSLVKIVGSELLQDVLDFTLDAMGHHAVVSKSSKGILDDVEVSVASEMLHYRAASVYGGTNEIQKNIIARKLLA